ncbi:MAG: hypothetical protein K6T91_02115 [Firmicutes bacterium]|nr:hypothetical protein [Bacillota bacterium]
MLSNDIFRSILYQFAKTIDDALLPQTTVSSLGLKIASQVKLQIETKSDVQTDNLNISRGWLFL